MGDLTREEFIKGSAAVIGASVAIAIPAPLFAAPLRFAFKDEAARSPKLERQHQDVVNCLTGNPQNYFVNPAGFVKFLAEQQGEGAVPFQAD